MPAAFLATILFSISAVSGSRATRFLGGTEANFWRLCFGAVLLAAFAHTAGGGIRGSAFPILFISGCIGFGVGDMALFQALPRLGSRLSVLLTLCLSSPLAAAIEWAWLGTELTVAEMLCAALILAGVAIALMPGGHLPKAGWERMSGIAFGLLAAACQALGAVLSRKAFAVAAQASENVDGITAAYQRILGGVVVGALVYGVVKWRKQKKTNNGAPTEGAEIMLRYRAWPWVLINGLSGPALGVSCYQWALMTTPTGVVLPIVAVTPIVIIPFSYRMEGERPGIRSLIGGVLAVAGAVALARVTAK
jgi:drug/metabolite transporter (DMT)-like permease